MPTLIREIEVGIEFAELYHRHHVLPTYQPRNVGTHLSEIIKHVAVATKRLKPGDPFEDEIPLRMAVGMAWEEFAVTLHRDMVSQPGEMCRDDIYMTPDGIQPMPDDIVSMPQLSGYVDSTQLLVGEFKATWKRVREGKEFLQEWYWMSQGMGYLAGFQHMYTMPFHLVEWHVLYVNDYRYNGPVYKRYLVFFTQKEIDNNWAMMLNNKAGSDRAIAAEREAAETRKAMANNQQ